VLKGDTKILCKVEKITKEIVEQEVFSLYFVLMS